MSGLEARIVIDRGGSFQLDVDLSIESGSTAALLGPNAAGKTTTVAALSGLLAIHEGRIVLGQRVLDDPAAGTYVPAEDRGIGIVFQDYLLFPHLTVLENIAFGVRSRGAPRERALGLALDWARRFDLEGLSAAKPGDLSGGQAQRVALARALVTEPDLLLLDEPLSALDVTTRGEMRRALADHIGEFAGSSLLITHDPTEAFLLADRIHVIEDGSITQTGTADDIRLRPKTSYAADLAGSNLIRGTASDGVVEVGGHRVHIADHDVSGPVLLTVRPTAISVHTARPDGSPRNSWPTTVDLLEALGDRVRLRTGAPLPLTVEVTREAAEALGLGEGFQMWLAIKATEIGVQSETAGRGATLPL